MYNRLIHFLGKFSILYEYQFSFKRKCSTHRTLISMIDELKQAIENGEYVICVFYIFQRRFILLIIKYSWTNYILMEFVGVLTSG